MHRGDWRGVVGNRPYEWGNPTELSPQTFLDALVDGNEGDAPYQVYYFSEAYIRDQTPFVMLDGLKVFQIAYVVTREQVRNLCNDYSCVEP